MKRRSAIFVSAVVPTSEARAVAIRTDPKASPRPDRSARMPDSADADKRTIWAWALASPSRRAAKICLNSSAAYLAEEAFSLCLGFYRWGVG